MRAALSKTRCAPVLSACALVVLAGCVNMSGLDGTSEYACKAPQGVQCDSVSGNYYNAVQNNLPSQRPGRGRDAAAEKARGTGAPTTPTETRPAGPLRTAQADAAGSGAIAVPLRSQSRVLRLWFKPWEDADHDLYDQGYVYVQIESGRWQVDHAQRRIRDAYAPIRAPRAAAQPEQSPLASGKTGDPPLRASESPKAPLGPLIGTPDVAGIDPP